MKNFMETRTNMTKPAPGKMHGFLRRAFKRVANASDQLLVDADLHRIAKRHQAVSLFAPTFKSWNR